MELVGYLKVFVCYRNGKVLCLALKDNVGLNHADSFFRRKEQIFDSGVFLPAQKATAQTAAPASPLSSPFYPTLRWSLDQKTAPKTDGGGAASYT